ncbi:TonB-dependent receptor [Phenylobacterium aquaticum]|uniref:TonB-dependent receptor n=1 Tax=Phenylobacterium aquaticum TaxID=1763816 RepID=UPI001F5C4FFB|nr:TonB-dependent receptor [Phenylobacterium aquaticum]MCI3131078.1 TonB-dependent receptor [Phenylobacterium aquaticum]
MRHLFSNASLPAWLLAGVMASLAAGAAHAADTQVEEVVVTAQKRAENVQDVPQAVQVVTANQLAAAGVREFTDLSKLAPSLVVRPAEQPVNSSVSIRGIGTFAFSIGVEPSVAIQVDDVPVAFQARAFTDLSDIERVEVLRGPQSTLYGKSASAGLINVVTRGPTPELSGGFNVLATTDDEYGAGGTLSGPITDKLAYRLSANYDKFEGNVRNVSNGKKAGGRDTASVHGKLAWTPLDTVKVTLGWNYVNGGTTVGRPFIALSPTAYLRGNTALPPSVFEAGIAVGPENTKFANNFAARTDYDDNSQSLKVEWDLGPATLVAVTGNDNYKVTDLLDVDETAVTAIDNRQIGYFKSGQLTQEVRLVSNGEGPLRYTVGAFYADVDFVRNFYRGPFFSLARWYATSGSKQEAAFGQLDWEVIPGTTLTGGARYQHETIDYTFLDIQNGSAYFHGGAKDNFWTYHAALNHKFTDDLMAYVSYSTGHKGQTYDLTTGFNSNRALAGPIRPETSKSWEVGTRAQFLEHRLTVNATAFKTNYEDFQAQGIETLPDGSTNFRLTNVGKLRTQGIEVDSSARLGDDWRLSASAAYVDAKITSFPVAQCYPLQTAAQGCVGSPGRQNLAGKRPAQAPKLKLSADLNYSHPIQGTNLDGVASATYAYQSKVNYALNQDPQTIQKGYGILNLTVGVKNPTRHYEVMAFVNNALNEHYYANIFDQAGTYNNQLATQVILPRDFKRFAGIRAAYSF